MEFKGFWQVSQGKVGIAKIAQSGTFTVAVAYSPGYSKLPVVIFYCLANITQCKVRVTKVAYSVSFIV